MQTVFVKAMHTFHNLRELKWCDMKGGWCSLNLYHKLPILAHMVTLLPNLTDLIIYLEAQGNWNPGDFEVAEDVLRKQAPVVSRLKVLCISIGGANRQRTIANKTFIEDPTLAIAKILRGAIAGVTDLSLYTRLYPYSERQQGSRDPLYTGDLPLWNLDRLKSVEFNLDTHCFDIRSFNPETLASVRKLSFWYSKKMAIIDEVRDPVPGKKHCQSDRF